MTLLKDISTVALMLSKVDSTVLAMMFGVLQTIAAEWNPATKPKSKDTHDNAKNPGNYTSALLSSCHASFLAAKAFDLGRNSWPVTLWEVGLSVTNLLDNDNILNWLLLHHLRVLYWYHSWLLRH